jgi:hypothetical protein
MAPIDRGAMRAIVSTSELYARAEIRPLGRVQEKCPVSNSNGALVRRTQRNTTQSAFFHPDYTVGAGFSPALPQVACGLGNLVAIPRSGIDLSLTLPRRLFHIFYCLDYRTKCKRVNCDLTTQAPPLPLLCTIHYHHCRGRCGSVD